MKMVYEALDGKIFEDDEECLDYEDRLRLNTIFKNIKFYDSNNVLMELKNIDDFFNALEYNYKIVIPTEEDCEIFNEWLRMNEYEIYMLPKEGTWYNINYENMVLEEELIKQIKDFKQKNSLIF